MLVRTGLPRNTDSRQAQMKTDESIENRAAISRRHTWNNDCQSLCRGVEDNGGGAV